MPEYLTGVYGVGNIFYKLGIAQLNDYIDLLKKLESNEVSDVIKKKLETLKQPRRLGSMQTFHFEPELDKKIFDAAMRFDVTFYDSTPFDFLHYLIELLPTYESKFSAPPKILPGYRGFVVKIERDDSRTWPKVLASDDKFGWVGVGAKYEGWNKSLDSSIKAYLVTDYKFGRKIKSNSTFLYTKFDRTPFPDGIVVLDSFREFSYSTCPQLKAQTAQK